MFNLVCDGCQFIPCISSNKFICLKSFTHIMFLYIVYMPMVGWSLAWRICDESFWCSRPVSKATASGRVSFGLSRKNKKTKYLLKSPVKQKFFATCKFCDFGSQTVMQILGYGTFSRCKNLHKFRPFCKKRMQEFNVLQYNKEQVFSSGVYVLSTGLKLCMRVFRNSFSRNRGQYYIYLMTD